MDRKFSNLRRGADWFWQRFVTFVNFSCAFLELHLVKLVSLSIVTLCCVTVNSLHMVMIVGILGCYAIGLPAVRFSLAFIGPFIAALLLSKMIYQTKFIPDYRTTVNCSTVNRTLETAIKLTISDPEWWGYELLKGKETIMSRYSSYVIVLFLMTLATVIKTRQKLARIDAGKPAKTPPVMYIHTTRQDADKNLTECLKYLINYGFYKFGIEITLSFCVFTTAYRMDVFSIFYAFWVAVLFLPQRSTVCLLWPFFFTTLLFSILWQYAMAVGFSKHSCVRYPWEHNVRLAVWLFLPCNDHPPQTQHTLVDFILLLLIQRQQTVFEIEKKYGSRFLGGSNKETYMDYYTDNFINPTPDHTGNINSWLDVFKYIFMTWLFRVTLAFEFWNGASNANILSLGYLVGAFVFLWIDYDLCLWHIKKILTWWNILLGYTVFVILFKTILEFCGCVYWNYLRSNTVWLVRLLFVECSYSYSTNPLHRQNTSIYWDVVCFTLVIFQRRYFQSYYFLHEVDDVLGIHKIQAMGARLMDELQMTKLQEFQVRERKTLMKIKKNMNRIKAWQKRMQGLNYNEPTDHATAIYMGDYLMFEDLNEVSSKLDESSSSSDEYEFDEHGQKSRTPKNETMSKFIGKVFLKGGEESLSRMQVRSVKSDLEEEESSTFNNKRRKTHEESMKKRKNETDRGESDLNFPKSDATISESGNRTSIKLFNSFLDSVMVSMIRFFKKNSRDYRYIQAKMKAERKVRNREVRLLCNPIGVTPFASTPQRMKKSMDAGADLSTDNVEKDFKKSSQILLVELINAICMFAMSKTELFCYIIIFIHTAVSPTMISLPLPLLVFFWGSLTTVRPTTTFWTVLIAYTEITVVIKALFQNSIFPWNDVSKEIVRPEYPPLFLGIHRNNQFVIIDLFLLLLLFLHRYKLKTLGLWSRAHEEETLLPQNLKVYKELPSERDYKGVKGNRSLVNQRKRLVSEITANNDSIAHFLQMATWKCTSKATAKVNKVQTKIKVKEIEGPILVTHEGRRLEPTYAFVTQLPDDSLEGNVVLRVYANDIVPDARTLFHRLSWVQHFTSIRKFFVQILVRDWRLSADFYTLIFIFEFLDFLLVFFGYSSFTVSREINSEEYFNLAENQVPVVYLVIMILHFLVIIIDRILYLRKSVVGNPFNQLIVPQMYYLISCFYFLMSAYQLRVGYPLRVQGHFLCKKYGYVNFYAYKGLQLIPFFNQLRIILDFVCIQSSLTMMEWIKMESIFQLVYENKCSRRGDIAYPVPRGQQSPRFAKLAPGILVLIGLIILIWLPFIVFALFNTVAQHNLPQEGIIVLDIGKAGNIFETTATFTDIIPFRDTDFKAFQNIYKDNRKIWSFLSLFDSKDVAALKFRFKSYGPWLITTEEFNLLNKTVQDLDKPISLYVVWEIRRIPRPQVVSNAKSYHEITLHNGDKARLGLAEAFRKAGTPVRINDFIPKFIHITNEGEAKPVSGFLDANNRTGSRCNECEFESSFAPGFYILTSFPEAYVNVTLTLEGTAEEKWWTLMELRDNDEDAKMSKIPFQSKSDLTIFTFNDKNIPKLLINISIKGIIGLYLSIVFVTWTFIRRMMLKYPFIIYDDMPNPDQILKLCHDIYLARENHEFELEEDLYAKLLFLFRSPETMIKVTRLNAINQIN
ncbi:hypothetical protein RUM43_009106 [Polyplax serrata]|uniref:Piezo non-specific cation channel R-Ras-binding domain-containing protein n=1 Tax=Polyplax serrata TaxID=468196 RepID=A0AAN8RU64_POLSC